MISIAKILLALTILALMYTLVSETGVDDRITFCCVCIMMSTILFNFCILLVRVRIILNEFELPDYDTRKFFILSYGRFSSEVCMSFVGGCIRTTMFSGEGFGCCGAVRLCS